MDRILVCDDDAGDLATISTIIDNFYSRSAHAPYSIAKFSHPWDALSYIESNNAVDIAVLDILMPTMSGIDLAAQMRKHGFGGHLVFLSSSNDFAHQSYAVKAHSYILKPPSPQEVFELFSDIQKTRRASEQNGFILTHRNGARQVNYSELMYVESDRHKLLFHLTDGETISIYAPFKRYEEKLLQVPQIVKAHRSYIVNLDHVRSCENGALHMPDGKRVTVPKDYQAIKENWLKRVFGRGGKANG
jgi:DNA-binding LytR/AlgR family response regulator